MIAFCSHLQTILVTTLLISPWHNIPLQSNKWIFNFIVKIPKEMSDKMEMATNEKINPIKEDPVRGRPWKYMYVISFKSI